MTAALHDEQWVSGTERNGHGGTGPVSCTWTVEELGNRDIRELEVQSIGDTRLFCAGYMMRGQGPGAGSSGVHVGNNDLCGGSPDAPNGCLIR